MGTTMVAVLSKDGELWIASVGDSRAYLFEKGELRALTEDQTWVNEVGRRLGIDEETLKNHPMRHVLTMAIGVSEQLRVLTASRSSWLQGRCCCCAATACTEWRTKRTCGRRSVRMGRWSPSARR